MPRHPLPGSWPCASDGPAVLHRSRGCPPAGGPEAHSGPVPLPFDSTLDQPLATDVEIEQRVALLIGAAARRQFWFLFLDERMVQLPLVVPVHDVPHRPYAAPAGLAATLASVLRAEGASAVVTVLERVGPDRPTAADREWAAAIHLACARERVPVRAVLISHPLGVIPLPLEDYRFGQPG